MTEQDNEPVVELVYDPSIAAEYRKEHPELFKPVPAEVEGDRWSWWYVCGDCHGAVEYHAEKCPHCGRRLTWE
ncbi:MAG: hypothetical protein K6F61_04985 [Clostridiales bacterium]|nr:hypothetical protein [Clostridiales bacterium]